MDRGSDKWFNETNTEKVEPNRQKQKSLLWPRAEDEQQYRVAVSKEDEKYF
jgi:hypothetical protein